MALPDRIVVDSKILTGKPVVRGTRITVELVVELLAAGCMRILADEDLPRPAVEVLRRANCDVFSIAEECPGVSDEEVAALCADQQRILLTFDKDFRDRIRVRPLSPGSGR